jgi:hypothetical protein
VLGRLDHTWDWPHVDLPSANIGFGNIEEAVRRGRACLTPSATVPCNFAPHLPWDIGHDLVQ